MIGWNCVGCGWFYIERRSTYSLCLTSYTTYICTNKHIGSVKNCGRSESSKWNNFLRIEIELFSLRCVDMLTCSYCYMCLGTAQESKEDSLQFYWVYWDEDNIEKWIFLPGTLALSDTRFTLYYTAWYCSWGAV